MRSSAPRAAAALAGALVCLMLLPPAPAEAALRTIRLEGRGYGHGRGMSQWGARGMAERGSAWHAIVAHYYRGARVARRPAGERIRVLAGTSSSIVVTSARRFTIRWGDGTEIGVNDAKRRFVRVRLVGAHYVLDASATPWGPWRRMTRSRRTVVFLRGSSPLEYVFASGASRSYRGTLEVRSRGGSLLDAINHLPLEEYLMGVVPREMPSSWPAAALRAQAVAARSYAVALKERWKARTYDICATTACQVYGGLAFRASPGAASIAAERPSTSTAVLSTARNVLHFNGRVVMAEYSSSSGGTTASGSQPYLRAVPDPADRISPHHSWSRSVDASSIERSWREIGRLRGIQIVSRDGSGVWGGRVRLVRLSGSRRTIDVGGGTFASRLKLRSRWYRVFLPGARYRFGVNFGKGSRGPAVAELQRRLRDNGMYRGPVSAAFDARTRDGVIRYQRSRRIRATGYVGPLTRSRLNAEAWP